MSGGLGIMGRYANLEFLAGELERENITQAPFSEERMSFS